MRLKTREQLLKSSKILDSRRVFKEEAGKYYNEILSQCKKNLKEKLGIEIANKDTEIFFDSIRNRIYVVQEMEVEIEDKVKVTDEMRAAGIKGEYITSHYLQKDHFIVGQAGKCTDETLSLFGFKRLPRVILEAKERKAA